MEQGVNGDLSLVRRPQKLNRFGICMSGSIAILGGSKTVSWLSQGRG